MLASKVVKGVKELMSCENSGPKFVRQYNLSLISQVNNLSLISQVIPFENARTELVRPSSPRHSLPEVLSNWGVNVNGASRAAIARAQTHAHGKGDSPIDAAAGLLLVQLMGWRAPPPAPKA